MDKWISVKDRMPQARGQYLVVAIEAGPLPAHHRRFVLRPFYHERAPGILESDPLDAAAGIAEGGLNRGLDRP